MTSSQQDLPTSITPYQPGSLPGAVRRYLEGHQVGRDADTAMAAFAPHARVADDGAEHTGTEAVRAWLTRAASEYTYTTTLTGQATDGPGRWIVLSHLEGDFPGGTVDLRMRFLLEDGLIAELVIAP